MAALDAACYASEDFADQHRQQIAAALKQFDRLLNQAPKTEGTDLPHLYPR